MATQILAVLIAAFLLVYCAPRTSCADTLVLKNGTKITGTIANQTPEFVDIESNGVKTRYLAENIREVQRDIVTPSERMSIRNATALSYFTKAKELRRENKYTEAIEELKKAEQADPGNSIYATHIGEIYYNLHQYDDSLKSCRRALDIDPNNSYVLGCATLDYYQVGKIKEARGAFNKFKKLFQIRNPSDKVYMDTVTKKVALLEKLARDPETPDREHIKQFTSQF